MELSSSNDTGYCFARSADPTKADVIAAAGGDGTIGEVVNDLLGRGLPLGIVPLGTTNVLAGEIGLSLCARTVATIIAAGSGLRSHIGLVNGPPFMMMTGVGFDAHVAKKVAPALKRCIGMGAYTWTTLVELLRYAPRRYEVTLEGSISAASVVIGIGCFYGG